MAASGALPFSGLADNTAYFAAASVSGTWKYIGFATPPAAASAGGSVTKASARDFRQPIPVVCLHIDDPTNPIKAALRRGYTFIWISELYAAMAGTGVLPDKPALLTFDDGHLATFNTCHPIVASYGIKANLFITSNFLYGTSIDPGLAAFLGGIPMTWANARTMRDTGLWEFHNHTQTHKSLASWGTSAGVAGRIAELNACNDAIMAELGVAKPLAVAYPSGSYNPATLADMRTAGIKLGLDFASGKSLSQEFWVPGEGFYNINRSTLTNETWLAKAYDDVFHCWENDALGGRNDANVLGYWTLPTGGALVSGGEDIRLDSRVVATAHSIISTDYFRVRKGERIYFRFEGQSELQTAGNGGIRLAQYDSAKAFISNIDLKAYAAAAGIVHQEGETGQGGITALAANCEYIRPEIWADATYDGLVHYIAGVLRRAVT